jgi:hypothetical protein
MIVQLLFVADLIDIDVYIVFLISSLIFWLINHRFRFYFIHILFIFLHFPHQSSSFLCRRSYATLSKSKQLSPSLPL